MVARMRQQLESEKESKWKMIKTSEREGIVTWQNQRER